MTLFLHPAKESWLNLTVDDSLDELSDALSDTSNSKHESQPREFSLLNIVADNSKMLIIAASESVHRPNKEVPQAAAVHKKSGKGVYNAETMCMQYVAHIACKHSC